jgi:haloacid dehalogenase-like hydrolase
MAEPKVLPPQARVMPAGEPGSSHTALVNALPGRARGIAHRRGQVLVACAAADEPAASAVIRSLGLDCRLVRNRGELMILPAGVTKGTGLLEALALVALSQHNAIGVGDAENDHSLLDVCEVGVAVANAVSAIRRRPS